MERLKRSLHTFKKSSKEEKQNFTSILKLARKKHNFKIAGQLTLNVSETDIQQIQETNTVIQNYFLKRIYKTRSLEKLQELHLEILNKIDFFDNTHEYELLAHHIYDKHLLLTES